MEMPQNIGWNDIILYLSIVNLMKNMMKVKDIYKKIEAMTKEVY